MIVRRLAIAGLLMQMSTLLAADLPIANFTPTEYAGWKTTGAAFGKGPVSGELLHDLEIQNAQTDRVISSEVDGDAPIGTLTSPEFRVERKFISFLIGGGDYERHACLNLLVDGKIVRSATGRNSDSLAAQSWDVSAFAGRQAQIQIVDEASGKWGHINVDQLIQTDAPANPPVAKEPLYKESLRPQFHFTARQWTMDRLVPRERQEGWLNDLNGLIYYEGEYHLFAQRWNKCWIHAVSRDLVHWTELEPAFWEESLDSAVQSGTCVIDYENTSGLSPDKATPPMIAFWSRNDNRSQCLSYSLDRGRTWKHYEKNPILIFPERDPKVFWHAPSKHWVMMLYGNRQYHTFTSTNLLDWKDARHSVKNSFECPDLFELPVDGNSANKKWVLIQGDGKYTIGSFDGIEFKEESERFSCDIGPNFYATQTFHNTETGDGRRIQTAWMRGPAFPDMPFNQQITFPCELTLRTTSKGPRIFRQPVREISLLHASVKSWTNLTLQTGQEIQLAPAGRQFHIKMEANIPAEAKLTMNIRGVPISIGPNAFEFAGKATAVESGAKNLEILVDTASIEAFVNQGEISSTMFVLPKADGISLKSEGRAISVKSLSIHRLKSAWSGEVEKDEP